METLVNKTAPDFCASAVTKDGEIVENFSLSSYRGKYVVLLFYPLDFTFVCPSEIIAHNNRIDEFTSRNTELIGISVDSAYSHYAWRNTDVVNGGIGNIYFPLVSDLSHSITKSFGIEHQDGVAMRGTFLIDKEGIIQHAVINNLPIGRNVDELIRTIDALQFSEQYGEVCPAGWQKGQPGMTPTSDGVANYLSTNAENL